MSSISTTESNASGSGAKVTGFVVLTILAVAVCGVALYMGDAPYKSPYPSDWLGCSISIPRYRPGYVSR